MKKYDKHIVKLRASDLNCAADSIRDQYNINITCKYKQLKFTRCINNRHL